jgi:hypothetical protein
MIILLTALSYPLSRNLPLLFPHLVRMNANLLLFLHQTMFPRCFSAWCTPDMSTPILKIAAGKALKLRSLPSNFLLTFAKQNRKIYPWLFQVIIAPALIFKEGHTKLLPNR